MRQTRTDGTGRWGARRRLSLLAAGLAGLLLVTACGNDPAPEQAAAPPSSGHAGHTAESPPPAAPLRDGERFLDVAMPAAYTPKAPEGATDEYRCFMVDPGLTSDEFLVGSQFLPQNVDIVHHAIFFRLGPEEVAAATKLDEGDAGEGWRCFGNAGVGSAAWVAHWAPGANEVLLDAKVGHPLPAGSRLVMQIHYNVLGAGDGPVGSDRSTMRLRLAGADSGTAPLGTALVMAPIELPCTAAESGPLCDRAAAVADLGKRFGPEAAGQADMLNRFCNEGRPPAAGATQSCTMPVNGAGTIHAVAGHMHLLGKSISVELNPGTDRARTLLDIPAYDFDDQAIRPLDEPVQVSPSDTVRVTCTHDASLRAKLPALQGLDPRYVVWGEGTSDEMCLGIVMLQPAA